MTSTPLRPSSRRLAVAGGLAAFALASAAAVEAIGVASRREFVAPPEMRGGRWAIVSDAGEAVRVWLAAGVHGRKLVVLTGRWGQPAKPTYAGKGAGGGPAHPQEEASMIDAESALFAAARTGVAREIFAVMPPAAFERRRAEIGGGKETAAGPGWLRQPFHGYPRTFARPDALPRIDEPALLLVEPSFFAPGTPPSLGAWLARRGIAFDLALVAADDPSADDPQREAAQVFAESVGCVSLQAAP